MALSKEYADKQARSRRSPVAVSVGLTYRQSINPLEPGRSGKGWTWNCRVLRTVHAYLIIPKDRMPNEEDQKSNLHQHAMDLSS